MGKVYQNKQCVICGNIGKVIEVFGKFYCKSCYDKKPKSGRPGHSGMLRGDIQLLTIDFVQGLHLEKTTKGNKTFSTLFLDHYPESKGILGRQLNYFIKNNGEIIGIIGFNSPPIHYIKFDLYFGKNLEKNYLNNNVFRIIKNGVYPASQILSLTIKQIKIDYQRQYGDKLIGLVTFVEPPRVGTLYKADNWDYLGETQGKKCYRRGTLDKWTNKEWGIGTKKLIFAKKILRGKYPQIDTPVPAGGQGVAP